MVSALSPQDIHGILERQCAIAQQLLQILAREFAALSGNDLQDLETTIAAKQQLMGGLEDLSQGLLARAAQNPAAEKADLARYLKNKDPQGAWGLLGLWHRLEELLSQCRQSNATNGKIISLNRRHVQLALDILRRGDGGAHACYSPTGAGLAPTSSRSLGKV